MTGELILPLETQHDALELIGGKGRSLARLINAGFDVPNGFLVSTSAYRNFVVEHDLQARILDLARPDIVDGTLSFEQSSSNIRQLFEALELSVLLLEEISVAYNKLDAEPAVAVRSSANAEDLPDLSFAGQQETYLNVQGVAAVSAAVKDCWASLWTAQALNYRHEMGVDQGAVAMAVVVQVMVPAEVAGILFTANPSNGERSELIINASFGLGEAVVSGQVTPDTYIVDRDALSAKETIIGAKDQMVVSDGEQGTRIVDVAEAQKQGSSLSDSALSELASMAIAVEEEFEGLPQDIEWALADGKLWLLQSRPITNLRAPPPKDVSWPEIPGAQLLKRQVAENMPDPLSPLFEDLYFRAIYDSQKWPDDWEWKGRLTKNWAKNFVVTTVNGYAYQPIYHDSGKQWEGIMEKYLKKQEKLPWYRKLKSSAKSGYFLEEMKGGPMHLLYLIGRTYRTFKKYPAIVTWEDQLLPYYLSAIERWQQLDPKQMTGEELLLGMKALTAAEGRYWQALRGVLGTAKGTDGALQHFLEQNAPDEGLISGTFLSGFRSKTLEAEVAMRAIAESIRTDQGLYELTIITPAVQLLEELARHPQGKPISEAIHKYLQEYGRQVFNLDFVEPTLAEEPLPFAMSLKNLVRDTGFDMAARQLQVAKNRRSKLLQALKFFKGKQRFEFLRLYWTARVNYPAREQALFYMGLAWSTLRSLGLELGERLESIGSLCQPDDVFYLTSDDLLEAIKARADDKAIPALGSKASAERELRQLRFRMDQPPAIPPIKEHKNTALATIRDNDAGENALRGFAVSPGSVTGIASVIMTPNDFDKMKPGTILVCPLTTPAWTQLFPHAIGLVTDIGSILAHGSIVAREYGIPAVLGVGDATQRVKNGQKILVDGDGGIVTILDE